MSSSSTECNNNGSTIKVTALIYKYTIRNLTYNKRSENTKTQQNMVDLPFYCLEQVSVPENFPNILKDYAKAAVRTQPYDLLKWSATYFHCLQMGIPPPAKLYYEKSLEYFTVTREHIRILIKQFGKKSFVSRLLLQQRWNDLSLPQEELLKYLSLCRMLYWPQIYWLKLIIVLVGSINKTPFDTLNMLCEVLTDNIDGADPYVPMSIFRICYTFLAELDCSEEQYFIDGRRLTENSEIEGKNHTGQTPQKFSPTLLREAVLQECRNRYMPEVSHNEKKSIWVLKKNQSFLEASENDEFSQKSSRNHTLFGNQHTDFDSIILLLREIQGARLHEYNESLKTTSSHIRYIKSKQEKINKAYEKQAEIYKNKLKNRTYEQQIRIVNNTGAPWTWLNEFVTESNCLDESYNFIDSEPIKSNVTQNLSSDESFCFDKNRFTTTTESIITPESSLVSIGTKVDVYVPKSETTSDEESNGNDSKKEVGDLLSGKIKKNKNEETGKKIIKPELELCLVHLRSSLSELELKKGVVSKTESVITFLRKEAAEVLDRAGEKYKVQLDLLEIANILEQAYQKGKVFSSLDEMFDYIRKLYSGLCEKEVDSTVICEMQSIDLTNGKEELGKEHKKIRMGKSNILQNSEKIKWKQDTSVAKSQSDVIDGDGMSNTENSAPLKLDEISYDKKEVLVQFKIKKGKVEADSNIDNKDESTVRTQKMKELIYKNLEKSSKITDVYDISGINVNKVKEENTTDNMILGLISKPEDIFLSKIGAEEIDESVEKETCSELSMIGNIQDDSSLQPSTLKSSSNDVIKRETVKIHCPKMGKGQHFERKQSVCSNTFACKIPPLEGIGPKISKETVQNFLTFLKTKSKIQNGMVCPRNFNDPMCPNITDCKA